MKIRRFFQTTLLTTGMILPLGFTDLQAQESDEARQSDRSSQSSEYEYDNQYENNEDRSDRRSSDREDRQDRDRQRNREQAREGSQNNRNYDESRSRDGQNDSQRDRNWDAGQQDEDSASLGVVLAKKNDAFEIKRVYEGSAAKKAGLKTGDQIVTIDDKRFDSARQLSQTVRKMNPNERVDVKIRRDGETRTMQVRLDSREDNFANRDDRSQREFRSGNDRSMTRDNRSNSYNSSDVRSELRELDQQVQRLANRIDNLRARLGDRNQTNYDTQRSNTTQGQYYENQRVNYEQGDQNRRVYRDRNGNLYQGEVYRDQNGRIYYNNNRSSNWQNDSYRAADGDYYQPRTRAADSVNRSINEFGNDVSRAIDNASGRQNLRARSNFDN